MKCKNCDQPVEQGWQGIIEWYHVISAGSVMRRCDPNLSGKPYGLNAEPKDANS